MLGLESIEFIILGNSNLFVANKIAISCISYKNVVDGNKQRKDAVRFIDENMIRFIFHIIH